MVREFFGRQDGSTDLEYAGLGALFLGGMLSLYLVMNWAFGDLLVQFTSAMSNVNAG